MVLAATLTGVEFARTGGDPSAGLHLAAFAKCRGLQSGRAGELWWTRHAGELWWRLSQGGGAGRVVQAFFFTPRKKILKEKWEKVKQIFGQKLKDFFKKLKQFQKFRFFGK